MGLSAVRTRPEVTKPVLGHRRSDDDLLGAHELFGFGDHSGGADGRTEFGGIRVGVRHTLLLERAGRPDIIATLDGHNPTGDTSYAIGGGLVLVKSVDPAVLFASANYRHAFGRDFSDVTRLGPRNWVDVSMGYGLGLNDTLAISTAVSGVFIGTRAFDDATLRPTDIFSLGFALTSWLAEGLYIEPSVSFGLSGPGNSFAWGVTLPYAF